MELPIELWMEIFEDCQMETLRDIALTSHAFRSAILPFMYRTFIFHPFVIKHELPPGWGRPDRFMPPISQVNEEIERLNFYSSDHIIPFVREIQFVPWPVPWHDPSITAVDSASYDPQYLSNRFYETLPRFVNVQVIQCSDIDFCAFALQQLNRLPNLQTIHLNDCDAFPTLGLATNVILHLKSFFFWHQFSSGQARLDQWIGLMDAETLEVLRVGPYQSSLPFFRNIASVGPFSSLRILEITIPADIFSQIPLLLSKTPALHLLMIGTTRGDVERNKKLAKQFSSPLISPTPYLSEYHGPHELLHAILGTSTQLPLLRQSRLSSLSPDGDHSANILDTLSSHVEQLKDLTHFHADLSSLTYHDLSKFCSMFPNLQMLVLMATNQMVPVTERGYLDELDAIALPPGITAFTLEWTLSGENQDINSDLITLKDNLTTRFPSLRQLWLCDWKKSALLWRKCASGEEESKFLPMETESQRWNSRGIHLHWF